jgi:hypothetical protein
MLIRTIVAAAVILTASVAQAADPQVGYITTFPIESSPNTFMAVDALRGSRLDNLLHCILFRVEYGTFPQDWFPICNELMAEKPAK